MNPNSRLGNFTHSLSSQGKIQARNAEIVEAHTDDDPVQLRPSQPASQPASCSRQVFGIFLALSSTTTKYPEKMWPQRQRLPRPVHHCCCWGCYASDEPPLASVVPAMKTHWWRKPGCKATRMRWERGGSEAAAQSKSHAGRAQTKDWNCAVRTTVRSIGRRVAATAAPPLFLTHKHAGGAAAAAARCCCSVVSSP